MSVGVLEKHGRHLAVAPFFERGSRINVDKPRHGERVGDLVQIAPGKGGRARSCAGSAGRTSPATCSTPLMAYRGLRRRFDPLVEREARIAEVVAGPERRDMRALTTFTIDPPTAQGLRRRDLAEELSDGAIRMWVHIADVVRVRQAGTALDREAYRRANSRLRPRPGRADAARGAVEPRVLADPGPGPARGDGRAGVRGREGPADCVPTGP